MRKSVSSLFLLLFAFTGIAVAADSEVGPFNFGGGINIKNVPSDIDDNESPDMVNMVNDIYGASFKRNGSVRFISQPISSAPITSIARVYASTGSTYKAATIATNKNAIYYSTNDVTPAWVQLSSGLGINQHWSFVQMNNKVIMTGDGLIDQMKQIDIVTGAVQNLFVNDGGTNTVTPRCKYIVNSKNYLIGANCADADLGQGTTNYPSRIYFSLILRPSSFTSSRFIDYRTDDGESLTGISELNKEVHLWKETSIGELDFTILNLTSQGGDMQLTTIVSGFGLYAPRTLASTGDYYIFGAKDGVRIWNGGRKSRLQLEDESRQISQKIQPIIDRCIRGGTWRNAVGKYYPKKQWYILSVEDPLRAPVGRNNIVLVYDLVNQAWFPFRNWNIESMATMDGIGDTGQFIYGDSNDAYAVFADRDTAANDPRKEIVIDNMDVATPWTRGTQNVTNVIEGTGSVSLPQLTAGVTSSSITLMRVVNLGEWSDKSPVIKADKLSFKVYPNGISNLLNLRVDLEVNDISNEFDLNFTSVTIASAALIAGNTAWSTLEIALSSFNVSNLWVDLSSEAFPFASDLTWYGIRIVSSGNAAGNCTVSIDDLRLVGAGEQPLNAYRYTKQFNFGTSGFKQARQILLDRELSNDSRFTIDIFSDFGHESKKINVGGEYAKELFIAGYGGTNSIVRLNSNDFSVLDVTATQVATIFDYRYLVADPKYVYAVDNINDRITKIDRSSMQIITASIGSNGIGTTNFNIIQQIAIDDGNLYITDVLNQRIKIHKKSDLSFVAAFGTLGLGPTSYHVPTGIAVDDRSLYVADDGNYRINKVSKTSFTITGQTSLNLNMVGETCLAVDDTYLYDAYNSVSPTNADFSDVILEKRSKADLSLLNKIAIRPSGVVAQATYTISGAIGITDDYIYISFADDIQSLGSNYIQKRLKSDFSIVKELKSPLYAYTIAGNGVSYKPKRKLQIENLFSEAKYVQLKYSEIDLDNNMKLFNQTFLVNPEGITENK